MEKGHLWENLAVVQFLLVDVEEKLVEDSKSEISVIRNIPCKKTEGKKQIQLIFGRYYLSRQIYLKRSHCKEISHSVDKSYSVTFSFIEQTIVKL